MTLVLGLILFSFFVTSSLVVPFIDVLYKMKMIRKKEAPDKGKVPLFDKLHDIKAGTPVGGGVLIILVVSLIYLFLFPFSSHMGVYIRSSYDLSAELFILFFTFISFGILGFMDDLVKIIGKPREGRFGRVFGLTRSQKFVVQWVLALIVGLMLYSKIGISIINIPFTGRVLELGIFYVPISALVIVFFSNAINITDGLDGLASGLLLICLIAFMGITASSLDIPLSMFLAVWIGSMLAFLYFNVWPARIFLGDAGALSFGAMLAVIGLLTGSLVALFVIGGLFFVEAFSSAVQMISLKYFNKKVFPIAPIHHTFLAIGWEEPKIVSRAWLAGIVLAILGLWLATI
jgi:phospho-N-acetylmuramoyl-pentapeptide-transferase